MAIKGAFIGDKPLAGKLSELSDTDLVTPADGDVVAYDTATSRWVASNEYTMFVQSTAGTRPTAGTAGRLHFATDTNAISWDTGSEWVPLDHSSLAGLTATDAHPMSAITGLVDALDGKATILTGTEVERDAYSATAGEYWYLTDGAQTLTRWNGTGWVQVGVPDVGTTGHVLTKTASGGAYQALPSFARIAAGTYTGDDTDGRTIAVGFQPLLVNIVPSTSLFHFASGGRGIRIGGGTGDTQVTASGDELAATLTATGFQVDHWANSPLNRSLNWSSQTYNYVAIG